MTITHQPLTFPPALYAKLAPSSFLTAHLGRPSPIRPSSRRPLEPRQASIHTGSLSHAHGSAVVRCGDTAAVCGVQAEILDVASVVDFTPRVRRGEIGLGDDGEGDEIDADGLEEMTRKRRRREDDNEMARLGLLVPNVELATGCSAGNIPSGGPPSAGAQALAQRVVSLLYGSGVVGMGPMRIWWEGAGGGGVTVDMPSGGGAEDMGEELLEPEVKAFWTLHISLLFISLDGPGFDAAWLALLAALRDTKLPRAWWDADREMVLCSDDPTEARGLELREVPVALSFGVFHEEARVGEKGRKWILADTDGFEEALCEEVVTVVVGEGDRVVRIEKNGGSGAGVEDLKGMVHAAGRRREEWVALLGQA